ncbi:MAG: RNA polymerase sigma factor [Planctomycetes bacterium]|nr:RNA polymerase sigma factor [Planctomycetota bacterium]
MIDEAAAANDRQPVHASVPAVAGETAPHGATAIDAWLRARAGRVLGLCLGMLGHLADAEDACQEVLIKASAGLAGWRGDGSLDGWLLRIAGRHCLDRLRGRRARPAPMPLDDLGAFGAAGPTRAPEAGGAAHGDAELLAVLRGLAERLTPQQRLAFLLRDLEGWELDEIARELECSAAAARSHLSAARKAVRGYLIRDFPEFLDGLRVRHA